MHGERRPRARLLLGAVLLLLGGGAAGWAIGRNRPAEPAPRGEPRPLTAPGGTHGAGARSVPESRAITNGLIWLAGAQEPDGSWDLAKWNPHHGKTGLFGFTEEDHWFAPAATGLAA